MAGERTRDTDVAIVGAGIAGASAALTDLLPTELRYSGIALGTNVAFAIFGGTAPLVATWLIRATGDLAAPAWYLVAVALFSACVTFMATRPGARAGTPSAPP